MGNKTSALTEKQLSKRFKISKCTQDDKIAEGEHVDPLQSWVEAKGTVGLLQKDIFQSSNPTEDAATVFKQIKEITKNRGQIERAGRWTLWLLAKKQRTMLDENGEKIKDLESQVEKLREKENLRKTQYLDSVAQNLQNSSALHKLLEECDSWKDQAHQAESKLLTLQNQLAEAQSAVRVVTGYSKAEQAGRQDHSQCQNKIKKLKEALSVKKGVIAAFSPGMHNGLDIIPECDPDLTDCQEDVWESMYADHALTALWDVDRDGERGCPVAPVIRKSVQTDRRVRGPITTDTIQETVPMKFADLQALAQKVGKLNSDTALEWMFEVSRRTELYEDDLKSLARQCADPDVWATIQQYLRDAPETIGGFWAACMRALLPFRSLAKAFYAEEQKADESPEIYVKRKELLGIAADIVHLILGRPDYDTVEFKRELVDGLNVNCKIILGPIVVGPLTYPQLQERIRQAGQLFRESRKSQNSPICSNTNAQSQLKKGKEKEGTVKNVTFSNSGPWDRNAPPDVKPRVPRNVQPWNNNRTYPSGNGYNRSAGGPNRRSQIPQMTNRDPPNRPYRREYAEGVRQGIWEKLMDLGETREKWDGKPTADLIKGLADILKQQEQGARPVARVRMPDTQVCAQGCAAEEARWDAPGIEFSG